MTTHNKRWYTLVFATLIGLFACHDGERYEGMRSSEEQQRLQALNDSMQHLTPNAVRLINEAMATADDSLTWYDYYLTYGRHYLLTSTPDSLLPYVNGVLRFTQQQSSTPRTRGMAAMALSSKASYFHLLYQQPDTVIALYRKAYELMAQSDMQHNMPDLSANLGDAYISVNDLPEASKWYRRALLLVDSLGLPVTQNITLYMGLGRIYTNMGDFKQARDFYEKADLQYDQMKPNMQSYFLNNYGNYFYYHKEYDKALDMFRRMKNHLQQYGGEDTFDMYLCKINMADVFLNLGQTDSARLYVSEAEPFFERNKVDVGIFYANTIRIGIALHEKDYAEVKRIIAAEHGATCNDGPISGIRNQYMSRYYSAIGDYKKAYDLLRDNTSQRDSTEYDIKRMQSTDIMNRLTEDTIRLHHQLELKKREIRYEQTRSALWMMLGLLVTAILAFVVWFNYERKRRMQNHIDMVMLRLANARQRISPHFVFNVLNSSITKTNDQETEKLLMMARLIRSNLDLSSRSSVSLAEELDFVSQYVEIERKLIGEDFEFTLDTPDRTVLEGIQIPSMLVQILTENAILHGLKNQPGQKQLTITVETNEKETRISVCDNGPGFDISKYNDKHLRTGLHIVRTTLASINQENKNGKMRFDIHNDNGCHATLTIPRNIKII